MDQIDKKNSYFKNKLAFLPKITRQPLNYSKKIFSKKKKNYSKKKLRKNLASRRYHVKIKNMMLKSLIK